MKRFKFNLEKVLQLREFKEEECKIALGKAVGEVNRIENEIKMTAIKRHNAASARFNDVDVNEITAWENYILRLDKAAQTLAEQCAKAQIVVEEKRALYLDALKDVKAIEKLKEKREKEYRKETLDLQMAEIDDITSARRFVQ